MDTLTNKPLFDSFDSDVLQKSLKVMELQDLLIYTTQENFQSNAKIISQKLINKDITPLDYSYCIYTIERYNSLHVKQLSKITSEIGRILLSNPEYQEILQNLKNEILERIFFRITFTSTPHILLYHLYKNGFYEEKDFLDRIIEIKRTMCNDNRFILPFIVWFMPLFEKYDHEFYLETIFQLQRRKDLSKIGDYLTPEKVETIEDDKTIEKAETIENDVFFNFYMNPDLKKFDFNDYDLKLKANFRHDDFDDTYDDLLDYKFIDPIEPFGIYNQSVCFDWYETWFFKPEILKQFKKDNWKLHQFLCENGYFPGSIEEVIYNDDVDLLIEKMKRTTISYKTKINYNIFYHSHVVEEDMTLIEYSAFCSSVKIFKYFINMLNKDEIYALTDHCVCVPYLATYSGCFEILKICDQFNVDISVSLFCASCFYKHEILNWLIEEKNFDINSFSPNYLCPLHQTASSNNLKGLLYLLWKGADLNKSINNIGTKITSPFLFGIQFNRYHTASLLLSSDKVEFKNIAEISFYVSMDCDINLFKKVIKHLTNNLQIQENLFNFNNFTSVIDFDILDFILDSIQDNENLMHILLGNLGLAFKKKYFKLADLLYNKFKDHFKSSMKEVIDLIILYNTEAVKIILNDNDFMNEIKNVYLLLLSSIEFKRLDIIKLILLKMKDYEFKLSELIGLFEISEYESMVEHSCSLFFKVFKYEKNEFYLFYFLILLF